MVSKIANAIIFSGKLHTARPGCANQNLYTRIEICDIYIASSAMVIPQINTVCAKVKKSLCDSIDFKRRLMLGNLPLFASFYKTLIGLTYYVVYSFQITSN